MTDIELDEILNRWTTPRAPTSLRDAIRTKFRTRATRPDGLPAWITGFVPRVVATAALGFAVILLVVTQARPQTADLRGVPYTVDSELIEYARDGSQNIGMYVTSYNRGGGEIVLAKWKPSALGTILLRAVETVHSYIPAPGTPHLEPEEVESRKGAAGVITGCQGHGCLLASFSFWAPGQALIQAGCVLEGPLVGRETILGHPTVAVEVKGGENFRTTLWRAPDLGCFALKVQEEARQQNGTFRVVRAKRALVVTRR